MAPEARSVIFQMEVDLGRYSLEGARFPGFSCAASIGIAKSSNVQTSAPSPAFIAGVTRRVFVDLDPVVIDHVDSNHPHVIFEVL